MDTIRIQEIAKEHTAIRETMRRIEQELDHLIEQPASQGGDWELPGLVRTFRKHLRNHFQLEEAGGLLGAAVQYYDAGSRRVAAELVSQHRNFERTVDRIVAEFNGAILDSELPAPVVRSCYDRDLRRLLTDLAIHEQVESKLLEHVISGESGPG